MFSCFRFHSSVDNQRGLVTSLACCGVAQKSKWGVWPENSTLLDQQNTSISIYIGNDNSNLSNNASVTEALFRAFLVLLIALGQLPNFFWVIAHM